MSDTPAPGPATVITIAAAVGIILAILQAIAKRLLYGKPKAQRWEYRILPDRLANADKINSQVADDWEVHKIMQGSPFEGYEATIIYRRPLA